MAIDNVSGGTPIVAAWGNSVADELNKLNVRDGSWTPAINFATPGNLSVAYSSRSGIYLRIVNLVLIRFSIVTSTFTHSTASGQFQITGLPFPSTAAGDGGGAIELAGWTKSGYTGLVLHAAPSSSLMSVRAYGSGQSTAQLVASDLPSGGTLTIRGTGMYWATLGS